MNKKEFIEKSNFTEIEKAVFLNSCDCLYFGYGFKYVNTLNLPEEQARKIYNAARNYMCNF